MANRKSGNGNGSHNGQGEHEDDLAPIMTLCSATLTGDVRDFLLDRLRDGQSNLPWNERNEAAQRETLKPLTRADRLALRGLLARIVEGR